ncbi:hypothetical protein [Glaciihabitans sp. dw_435]|uniref:hypothetical protein n=1 Tax=Glaciihabitans sp. dw_435 TaxID=2720081 RepID=UPI001BD29E61|nr:hypothetical protein [Glaciihabitans sp. dw_435]
MTHSHLAPVSAEIAYRVPWHFERENRAQRYALRNLGAETLTGVTLTLHGGGVMPATAPSTLAPGDTLVMTISGRDLARQSIAMVRWFRPNGQEYLWPVSF